MPQNLAGQSARGGGAMIYAPNWAGEGVGVGLETGVGRPPMTMWWPYRNSLSLHMQQPQLQPLHCCGRRGYPISTNYVHSERTIMCSFNFGGSFGGPSTCGCSFFASPSPLSLSLFGLASSEEARAVACASRLTATNWTLSLRPLGFPVSFS